MADSSKGYTPSEADIRQILDQMMKETLSRLSAHSVVSDTQLLMRVPLDLMQQYLKLAIAQRLEIAYEICVK